MNHSDRDDPSWNRAWEWVIQEHEHQLDDAERSELVAWLRADPAHMRSYDEAHRIWLAASLIPLPADDPDGGPDGDESAHRHA